MNNNILLKITNSQENHHGYQYVNGLNILTDLFNDNPNDSGSAGGFYYTNSKYIHRYYKLGIYVRIVKLPTNDPDFKKIVDPVGDKWRCNKIILLDRYPLSDFQTYIKLGIKFPTLSFCIKRNYFELANYIIDNVGHIYPNSDIPVIDRINYALEICSGEDSLDAIIYLVSKGADIHHNNDYLHRVHAAKGHVQIVNYLRMMYYYDGQNNRSRNLR